MHRPPLVFIAAAVAVCLLPTGVLLHGEEPLIQVGDAFITGSDDGPGWTIGNDQIHFTLAAQGQSIAAGDISNPVDGLGWQRSSGSDTFVNVNGQRLNIGSTSTPFQHASVTEWFGGVRLDLTYRFPSQQLDITRSYACYPGSSVIETWTSFHAGSRSVTLSDLTNYNLTVQNGTVRWVSGLNTPDDAGGGFTQFAGDLDDGQVFQIGSSRRASEENMPWFSIKTDDSEFFGSILWPGSWRIRLQRQGDAMQVQLGLPTFATTLSAGASLETPHGIFGATNSLLTDTSTAVRSFVENGIRHGRPYRQYVTYNTWYSYGTFVEQNSLLAEMELAKNMGVEQFVIDAGWWAGINSDDAGDFGRNWGTWQVDPDRFPDGLGALSDRAHELGMRFGVWIEPERVDRATVGLDGLAKDKFLATRDGRYDPSVENGEAKYAQICLADPEARQWLLERIVAFIDEARPDYIKWDNNFWVNCNRAGHSHGAEDGNFAHHQALRDLLDQIRDLYPDLDIENCASGGSRLSLDMLAHSDVAWVDDRTDPSTRVRHNLEGLLGFFPPSYLLTFARTTEAEPVSDDQDLPKIMRSRMGGALGISWLSSEMSEGTTHALSNEIGLYKLIRPILQQGSGLLLTPQYVDFPDSPWTEWDVIEQVNRQTGEAVILAFDPVDGPDSARVRPKSLRADMLYDVESADYGVVATATGADLMNGGIELQKSSVTRSHVLLLHKHKEE